MRHTILLAITMTSVAAFTQPYFYCVTNTNKACQFKPSTEIRYSVEQRPLKVGEKIRLGNVYQEYTISGLDIGGGGFSSITTVVGGSPTGYFVFPSSFDNRAATTKLVRDLKQQCRDLIKTQNLPGEKFKEIRISESYFSGCIPNMQTGYPAVWLRLRDEQEPDIYEYLEKQNIFRIAD